MKQSGVRYAIHNPEDNSFCKISGNGIDWFKNVLDSNIYNDQQTADDIRDSLRVSGYRNIVTAVVNFENINISTI